MGKSKKGKKDHSSMIASNRKAYHDYEILKDYEAGLELTGTEIKSLRSGKANITQAHIFISEKNEAWLENSNIAEYAFGTWTNHSPTRRRKLLMHKIEIIRLKDQVAQKGLTIVPLKLYWKGSHAKLSIGLARGKHLFDKRETLKRQEMDREAARAVKSNLQKSGNI